MSWTREPGGLTTPRALLALAFAVCAGHALLYGAWISDDAGISFTYARNLAAGHGLVLNPGGGRVEGYSNPLWVFLLSPAFSIGIFHPVATPKVISIALSLASLWLLHRVSALAFGREGSVLHTLPPLLLSAHVPFVTWSVSGLENPLYVLLILAALGRQLREASAAGALPLSAILWFLVSITRPEGIIYFAVACLHRTWIAHAARRSSVSFRQACVRRLRSGKTWPGLSGWAAAG